MSVREGIIELRRRAILDFLEEGGGTANDDIVATALNALGHRVARDAVRIELAWLHDAALLTVETVGPYMVAALTPRGRDVALGQAVAPGVRRFRTGS